MTSSGEKNFNTGLRIIEILKLFYDNDYSKDEIIELLKDNEKVESVYTYEAFIKYFNTMQYVGLNLEKEKNKYKLTNALKQEIMQPEEIEILKNLMNNYKILHNESEEKCFKKAMLKINKHLKTGMSDEEILKILDKEKTFGNNVSNNLADKLNKMLKENLLVVIKYIKGKNNHEEVTVELREIVEKQDDFYIVCYVPSTGKSKKIHINTIISVTQLPKRAANMNLSNSVTYELFGRLIKSYKLKENESLITFNENYLLISNHNEDRELLMRRLLKYGENCKIVSPKDFADDFKNYLEIMLTKLESAEK